MRGRCPHAINPNEQCPLGCHYAMCERTTHQVTSDPMLIFDPERDFSAAAKETCTRCVFFLTNGPRL